MEWMARITALPAIDVLMCRLRSSRLQQMENTCVFTPLKTGEDGVTLGRVFEPAAPADVLVEPA